MEMNPNPIWEGLKMSRMLLQLFPIVICIDRGTWLGNDKESKK